MSSTMMPEVEARGGECAVRLPFDVDLAGMRRNAERAASLLKGLANENRLLILCVLSEGEISVGQLNKRVDLSQSALSQHLAVLRQQGLVRTRREAQTIYYSLAPTDALKVVATLHDIYCGTGT